MAFDDDKTANTSMSQFVHLHVHSQYSILDGQASIQRLVDKAMADGQPGIAITDHGDMFGIKEFYNYVKKVKGKYKDKAAECEKRLAALRDGTEQAADPEAEIAACERQMDDLRRKMAFKPIIGCEVYVARRRLQDKEGKPDQSGYHLILLAKNLKGYHNLIKIVSKAWTEGFYMRPRTDRTEIEKYHEGLICCSACLAGEVPRAITADDMERAEESIRWHKGVFGDDYYLELQLHKATVERANHEAYPMQLKVNKHLRELAAKYGVRMVCTNDVHFVDEDNAEAHDRLICLSTGKDLDDPKRMLYSKQEWLKTTAEMAAIFGETDPGAMQTTVDICNQVECYSIDHAPIMPTFAIPAEFGTEEEYRARYTEQDLYDEFTRDEHGNVVMSEEEGRKKIASWTRYVGVLLGLLQGLSYYALLRNQGFLSDKGVLAAVTIIMTFTAGTALIMWMGEHITQKGIGNGISIILFAGIVSRGPSLMRTLGNLFQTGTSGIVSAILMIIIGIFIVVFIVFMSNAERRIPVQYAKRVVGRKMYGGQSTHLPMKVNMSGVLPIIFAQSIATLPATIAAFTGHSDSAWASTTSIPYAIIYFLLIIFFAYFYSTIQFNPVEVANNLKKNGGYIPGFRPGKPTSEFIKKVLNKITLFGAIYLGIIAIVPILISHFSTSASLSGISLGGTSIIIVVGVALETVRALEAQMLMRNYKGFLS